MTQRLSALALGLVLSSAALQAHAVALSCTGSISQIQTSASGEVRILPAWRGDWVTLCNVTTVWKGIPVEVCKRWHAHVLTAQIAQTSSRVYYATTTAATCGAMGNYANADAPEFVGNN